MIRQPLALVDGIWTCAWCAARLSENIIRHRDDCTWIADIRSFAPTRFPKRQAEE